jgi:phage FluMu protein Com
MQNALHHNVNTQMVSSSDHKLVNEFQAAAMVGLSPRLLGWLTKHAPKQGVDRKLKVKKQVDGISFFDEEELRSFNEWLRLPWPHKEKKRPPIPAGIREEIRVEANGECAICNAHGDTCQAAHLDPVAKSKNNHPENLLWLCSNHHIAYDDGLYGPDDENAEFVKSFKIALHRHKTMLWRMQHEVSSKLFLVLTDCDRLATELEGAKTKTQIKAVERLATKTLSTIAGLAPVSYKDASYKAYKAISPDLRSLTASGKSKLAVAEKLHRAQTIHTEYVTALGYVKCPLCKGSGDFHNQVCPECGGDGEMPRSRAEQVDTSQYKDVKCPLCKGSGNFHNEVCPECGGEREMPRGRAEQVDTSQYKDVKCPLCKGSGNFHNEVCPECGGEGDMPRGRAEQVDTSQYKDVKCPLCKGSGNFHNEVCPECGGEGEMSRGRAEQVDTSQYKDVKCPLCKGSGDFHNEVCPECGGEGDMPRWRAEQVDTDSFE